MIKHFRLVRLADAIVLPRRFPFAVSEGDGPCDQHDCALDQEPDVPIEPLRPGHGLVDVVDAQDLMVDQSSTRLKAPNPISSDPANRPPQVRPVRPAPEYDQSQ
jgi:hypothetical protein